MSCDELLQGRYEKSMCAPPPYQNLYVLIIASPRLLALNEYSSQRSQALKSTS